MSNNQEKEYGLILPNSKKKALATAPVLKKPSIFESDSDSDDSGVRPTGISAGLKRQDKEIQNKAIEEDPTIFQYDELYDDMDQKRKESKLSRKDLDKKPKYISNLLKAAEKRKLENERRIERQVQREREAEGNEFKDKEQFVTAAYKKKLEEMREQEELEKREEYLETIGDVTKQGNLDGFYRHLYEQKVNYNEDKEKKMEDIKTTVKESSDGEDEKGTENTEDIENQEKKTEKKRQYRRKRSQSKSDDDNDEINTAQSHLPSNLDADSDFSIDSDSEDDENKKKVDDEPKEKRQKKEVNLVKTDAADTENKENDGKNGVLTTPPENVEEVKEIKPKKPKVDIWKKRTVGVVFDDALQRYYERKALRESG